VGYTLDEILNDITRVTPACFEPSIDYCVVKVPRFAFEKFKGASEELTTRMKSVGEAMAIGRTFEEALQKALRSLEEGHGGLGADGTELGIVGAGAVGDGAGVCPDEGTLGDLVSRPTPERIFYVAEALRRGWDVGRLARATRIDPWFLCRMADVVAAERAIAALGLVGMDRERMLAAKQMGFSDTQIAWLTDTTEEVVRAVRTVLGVRPVVKTVDTCAGEFAAQTSYHYLTYEAGGATEHVEAERPRVVILSAGPNRIGQGIEFDYCCVHASYALRELGFETVMVNCNPETVSTDYDTSDRLYFEPLTFESVMDVVEAEKPAGVIVTLGGQTPIKLAQRLEAAGVVLMGTSAGSIDLAEDRDRFSDLL
ncbi:MAG: carbamoyl phosphate synthase large subunit, partial [Atopobiaceae bacterium]|nr:carbamoyl phosphate synthase large subunit [Atopobiaceae bacterium]